jgi:hypothetical protein
MAVRTGRDLLRVWLVFALLWVVATGVVTYRLFLAESPTDHNFIFTGVLSENEQHAIQFFAEASIIPPVVAFVVGAAVRLAFKGFRGLS